MREKPQILFFVTTLIMALALQSGLGQTRQASESQHPERVGLMILQYDPKGECLPVQISGLLMGGPSKQAVTSAARIKNLSAKPVSAVKLGWYVVGHDEGIKLARPGSCSTPSETITSVITGETARIELEHLDQNETCKIATQNAASVIGAADKTVIVNSPIISMDDVKALTTDGTLETVKGDYVILVAVSEVEYEDGSRWELGGVPWRSTTQ